MRALLILVPGLLLAAGPSDAEETYEDIVTRAFAAIEEDYDEQWSFTETTHEHESVAVAHYDPRLPVRDRWSLVSVDGRAPTDDESYDFFEKKNAEHEEDEADDGMQADTMIEPGSLELLEETSAYWLFGFAPLAEDEDDEKFMRDVNGKLRVIKDRHYLAEIDLRTDKTVKPETGVKLETFSTRLNFGPAKADGPIVLLGVEVAIKGRAFFVVNIDEQTRVRYTDFQRVVEE